MENLVFTAKKRPKPVSINETAVMRVSAETYNTLRELHSLTGLPMIQILQKSFFCGTAEWLYTQRSGIRMFRCYN